MRVLRFASVSLLVLFLFSCASTYQLSPTAQRLKADMNREKAQNIVASVVKPSNKAGGICPEGMGAFSAAPGRPIVMKGSVVHFYAYKVVKVESKNWGRIKESTMQLGRYQFDISTLNEIAVLRNTVQYGRCLNSKPGYVLKLHAESSEVKRMHLNVAAADVNKVIAALSYLSPGAKLKDIGTF